MYIMKLQIPLSLRRVVSLVMILAFTQVGLLGGSSSVLAQSGETVSDTVYQDEQVGTTVYGDVYGDEESPITFLNDTVLSDVYAPWGKASVSGQVTENSTGTALADVKVRLLVDGHPTQFCTSTDSKGSYTITGVNQGPYKLTFQKTGYDPEEFGLEVKDANVKQDCSLFRNTSFKGHVVNEFEEPLEAAKVTLVDQNTPNRGIELSTNTNGQFYLVDVPPGRYKLSVSQSVYHKQKSVWIDEYPLELTFELRGGKPHLKSVSDDVYGETSNMGETNNGQASADKETSNDSSKVENGVNEEQPIEEPVKDPTDAQQDKSTSSKMEHGVNEQPSENGKLNGSKFEFYAIKEEAPLTELEKLLKRQIAIA